ncbi:hypothetical protein K1720_03280 [Thermococcus argininiproducens]|uniref:Uncharacterized protein n=1 Tax=Thermococcus argininiproducens TaxID=2866384 RepID=A0A9E7MAQ2_9EURY|nr:hypothetical protein [Thermococcus argininiproducens]USH00495.1 hypothetical protein K1720_03280 [Thermococcus argininiproducens]
MIVIIPRFPKSTSEKAGALVIGGFPWGTPYIIMRKLKITKKHVNLSKRFVKALI